jgi:hypothetical protein
MSRMRANSFFPDSELKLLDLLAFVQHEEDANSRNAIYPARAC